MKRVTRLFYICLVASMLLVGCQKGKESAAEYRLAGIAAMESKDYAGAIEAFELSLNESKGKVGTLQFDVLKYRAEAEYKVEDYAAVVHTLKILNDVDKERSEYLTMQSLAYSAMGDVEAAMDCYSRAIAIEGDYTGREESLLTLVGLLATQERFEEILVLCEQALTDGIQTQAIYNQIGLCKIQAQDYDSALSYLEQGMALQSEETLSDLWYNQAVVYEYQGKYEQALAAFLSYQSTYGTDADLEKEIAFLKTR